GILIFNQNKIQQIYGKVENYFNLTPSNNVAELSAILIALQNITEIDHKIIIYSDSLYSITSLNTFETNINIPNYKLISHIKEMIKNYDINFQHVDAHQ